MIVDSKATAECGGGGGGDGNCGNGGNGNGTCGGDDGRWCCCRCRS